LCCAWGNALDDGVLTFSIKNGGSDLAKIVKLAINDWEKALNGLVKFKHIKDENADSDIEIEFKKGKGQKVGKAVTFFDQVGLINHVEISISKKSYGVTLNKPTLEHVAKHEFGHALGIGHAEFKNSLMSPNVDEVITKMSACELESVKYANSWKFIDEKNSPQPLDEGNFKCKKDY
jgi:predicted Zn-dependent protease